MEKSEFAVHVDCDNLWIYETEYGFEAGGNYDLIYEEALPNLLTLFGKHKISATFFVIGKDTELESCREFCLRAVREGHKIANHTMNHVVSFSSLDLTQRRREIIQGHERLGNVTGISPEGYRSPGYFADIGVYNTLRELGYLYDSSIVPGPAVLMMQLYLFIYGKRGQQKRFGRFRDIFSRKSPSPIFEDGGSEVFEVPLAISPKTFLPIHTTFAYKFGVPFLMNSLTDLSKRAGHHVYLIHAVDTLDLSDGNELSRKIPALDWSFEKRVRLLDTICGFVAGSTRLTERAVPEWLGKVS